MIEYDLNTKKIKLESFTSLTDIELEEILRWRNSELIRKNSHRNEIISLSRHLSFVDRLAGNISTVFFKVSLNKDPIGVISLTNITPITGMLGIYKNPYSSHSRVGTCLMEAILHYSKKQLNLKNISLEVKESNLPAIHLYKRFNFKEIRIKNGIKFMEKTL